MDRVHVHIHAAGLEHRARDVVAAQYWDLFDHLGRVQQGHRPARLVAPSGGGSI